VLPNQSLCLFISHRLKGVWLSNCFALDVKNFSVAYTSQNTVTLKPANTQASNKASSDALWLWQVDLAQCVRVLSDSAMQLVKLQQQIEQLSKPDTDSVRIYGLDASAARRTITYNSDKPCQDGLIIL